jgi:hypothetical protein
MVCFSIMVSGVVKVADEDGGGVCSSLHYLGFDVFGYPFCD